MGHYDDRKTKTVPVWGEFAVKTCRAPPASSIASSRRSTFCETTEAANAPVDQSADAVQTNKAIDFRFGITWPLRRLAGPPARSQRGRSANKRRIEAAINCYSRERALRQFSRRTRNDRRYVPAPCAAGFISMRMKELRGRERLCQNSDKSPAAPSQGCAGKERVRRGRRPPASSAGQAGFSGSVGYASA